MNGTTTPKRAKRRLAVPAVIAGGLSSLLLAFSLTPTFSALTAAITNTTNTAGTAAIVMEETSGATTCKSSAGTLNAFDCAINKYGGALAQTPGAASTVNLTIKNSSDSSVAASGFTLASTGCTQSNNGTYNGSATDLCSKYAIVIKSGTVTLYTGPASAFTSATPVDIFNKLGITTLAVGASIPITITATLDGTLGNAYQGLKISQPLTWTFTA